MTIQITVIGLGQIGASIGLALGRRKDIYRMGHDREPTIMSKAKVLNALDATSFNLPASVEKADVVILCLPLDQVEETLKHIAPDLRENAVVLDTSPLKTVVAGWFEQHVSANRHYIGLVPAINPLLMRESGHGLQAARADLFDKATIGIAAPPEAPPEALKLAEDLVRMLGAQPLFLELPEADGALMNVHTLPQVVAAALLGATSDQPGWQEARRFAGRPFAQATGSLGDDPLQAVEQALLLEPEKATHALNVMIDALTYLRNTIQAEHGTALQKRLHLAFDQQSAWLQERNQAQWEAHDKKQAAVVNNPIQRLFLGSRPKKQ